LTAEGAYDQALNQVMRSLELHPDHALLRDCGTLVIAGRELSLQHMQTLLCAADHARALLEIEQSRKEQLAHHVEIAGQHLRAGAFDEALTEIALGFTVDPFSQELRDLEQEVWKGKAETADPEEDHQPTPEASRLVGLHILAAEEFARGNDFTAALDCLAKAYTIDPAHPEIKRAENRIRQQELRHRQQSEPPLKLVYHHERVANGL
jgi:tetratricopeptide (TPR) repeat protein